MEHNLISQAIEIVGLAKLARFLGVTYQAIRKWEAKGRLPRTEWTGETDYASLIEQATEGKVSKVALLSISQTCLRGTASTVYCEKPHISNRQEAA